MKYALILNNKVENIIETSPTGLPSGMRFPAGYFTVDCSLYDVARGDDYIDGVFSRDSVALAQNLTDAQKIAAHDAQITDIQLAIIEMYEGSL